MREYALVWLMSNGGNAARCALWTHPFNAEQRCGAPRYSTLVDRVLQECAKIRPQVPSDPTPLEVWIGEKAFERYLTDAKQKAPNLTGATWSIRSRVGTPRLRKGNVAKRPFGTGCASYSRKRHR